MNPIFYLCNPEKDSSIEQASFAALWDKTTHAILLPRRMASYPSEYCGTVRDFPGGGRQYNETLQTGLQRELKEELGIEIHHPNFRYLSSARIWIPKRQSPPHWIRLFLIEVTDPGCLDFSYPDGEATDAQWIPWGNLEYTPLTFFQKHCFLPVLLQLCSYV